MDRRAHGDPRAACGRAWRGALRLLPSGCARRARPCGGACRGPRPAHRRHGDAGHGVPGHGGARGRPARREEGRRLRSLGGLHGVRVCPRAGLRDAGCRSGSPRARHRRRSALEGRRLVGPLDVRPLRGWSGRRRARARRPRRLPGVRARRRRVRRDGAVRGRRGLPQACLERDGRCRGALRAHERP